MIRDSVLCCFWQRATTLLAFFVLSTLFLPSSAQPLQAYQVAPHTRNPEQNRYQPRQPFPNEVGTLRNRNNDGNDPDAPQIRIVPQTSVQNRWTPRLSSTPFVSQALGPPTRPPRQIQPVRIAPDWPQRSGTVHSQRSPNTPLTMVKAQPYQDNPIMNSFQRKNAQPQGQEADAQEEEEEEEPNQKEEEDLESVSSNNATASNMDMEEIKLKTQTKKLVKWLRNRLRKRLEQVANLESEMETEAILLTNLNQTIEDRAAERHTEIRLKLDNQKRLSSFRKKVHAPDEHVHHAQEQKARLSEQLARITRTYETLAQVHKDLLNKLRSAGLSHWLQTRGNEYIPQTAVGVLSKSADILNPVTQGIEKALELDNHIVEEVESVVPDIARRSIISKVLADVAMIMPLIPLFVLWYRMLRMLDSLSIVHIVLYVTGGLVAELFLVILFSGYFGQEALHVCQLANESFFSGGVLFNFVLLLGVLCAQALITALQTCRSEIVQLISCLFIVHHFWRHVFVPTMVGHTVTTTVAANVVYDLVFTFIAHQKKEALSLHTAYDKHISKAWDLAANWTRETAHAMGNVFREGDCERTPTAKEEVESFLSSRSDSDSEGSSHDFSRPDSFDERVIRVDGDARPVVVDAPMQMRYARWTGPTAWSIRQNVPTPNQPWREEQAHDVVGVSRSRRFARFSNQMYEPRNYRSCLP